MVISVNFFLLTQLLYQVQNPTIKCITQHNTFTVIIILVVENNNMYALNNFFLCSTLSAVQNQNLSAPNCFD